MANYSNKIRPLHYQDETVYIYISFYLSSLIEVDTVHQRLVTAAHLGVVWVDEFLQWDQESTGIEVLHFKQGDIWIPDLVLMNSVNTFEEMGGDFYYVTVIPDGTVYWYPYQVFESKCEIDTTYFPFDIQTCKLSFISWAFGKEEVNVSIFKENAPIDYYFYVNNPVWEIKETTSHSSVQESSTMITFTLALRRKPKFYVINLILPIILLGVISLLVFVVPADAGEKMSFAVTVFLSFAVFLSIISMHIPIDSVKTSMLEVYLTLQMSLGMFMIFISSFQLRLHHRKSHRKIGAFYRGVVRIERFLRCSACLGPSSLETSDRVDEIDWNDVSSAIDFCCFWIILVSQIVIAIVLFMSYI
ncbi:neuronal acetylcholine receptor subunit alpha-6-like [Ostrea edulis]|uniref:neuronal acetylcholine receptor subunit alpha-6-like n=1 Tax=Ostrea edulis TaxID=37623 RepID=UPI00209654B0|nr:neuronal acetylcholine receptor subunit alpha-6-like [Ostrea edulis]